jgi:hypothetical protein
VNSTPPDFAAAVAAYDRGSDQDAVAEAERERVSILPALAGALGRDCGESVAATPLTARATAAALTEACGAASSRLAMISLRHHLPQLLLMTHDVRAVQAGLVSCAP